MDNSESSLWDSFNNSHFSSGLNNDPSSTSVIDASQNINETNASKANIEASPNNYEEESRLSDYPNSSFEEATSTKMEDKLDGSKNSQDQECSQDESIIFKGARPRTIRKLIESSSSSEDEDNENNYEVINRQEKSNVNENTDDETSGESEQDDSILHEVAAAEKKLKDTSIVSDDEDEDNDLKRISINRQPKLNDVVTPRSTKQEVSSEEECKESADEDIIDVSSGEEATPIITPRKQLTLPKIYNQEILPTVSVKKTE